MLTEEQYQERRKAIEALDTRSLTEIKKSFDAVRNGLQDLHTWFNITAEDIPEGTIKGAADDDSDLVDIRNLFPEDVQHILDTASIDLFQTCGSGDSLGDLIEDEVFARQKEARRQRRMAKAAAQAE